MHITPIHVQPTIGEVVQDVLNGSDPESIWLNQESIKCEAQNSQLCPPFELNGSVVTVKGINIYTPSWSAEQLNGKVTCGDADPHGNTLVGSSNGELIYQAGDIVIKLEGHLLHTSVAKLFPSWEVGLSAGLDYSIKLWDFRERKLAQQMIYQRGNVSAVAMIDAGRNFLSCCPTDNENAVCLWECGANQVVRTFSFMDASDIAVWNHGDAGADKEHEYGVSGKCALVAADTLQLVDFRASQTVNINGENAAHISVEGNYAVWANSERAQILDLRTRKALVDIDQGCQAVVALEKSKFAFLTESSVFVCDNNGNGGAYCSVGHKTTHLARQHGLWTFGDATRHFSLKNF